MLSSKTGKVKSLITQGNMEEANLLLRADPGLKNKLGYDHKFLIKCVKNANLEAVKLLVECGADIHDSSSNAMTALGWAIYREDHFETRLEIADFLIEQGADQQLVCTCHGHLLIEALSTNNIRMFTRFLNQIETMDQLMQAIDPDGRNVAYYVQDKKNKLVQRAYDKKLNSLKKPAPEQAKQPSSASPWTVSGEGKIISYSENLGNDMSLTEIYNFHSERRITMIAVKGNIKVETEYFQDIKTPHVIEDAAARLHAKGGDIGRGWVRRLIYKDIEKGPGTAKKPR